MSLITLLHKSSCPKVLHKGMISTAGAVMMTPCRCQQDVLTGQSSSVAHHVKSTLLHAWHCN